MEEKKIDQQVAPQVVEDIDSTIALGTTSLVDKTMDESAVMSERKIEKVKQRQRVAKIVGKIGVYVFLIAMALIVLFPFYWMIISSLKTKDE